MPDTAVRLTHTEDLILGLLARHGEMYGLAMVHESAGLLARGTVYVVLDRMEDKGLITSRHEARRPGVSGMLRRLYKPTAAGARAHRMLARRRAAVLGVPSTA